MTSLNRSRLWGGHALSLLDFSRACRVSRLSVDKRLRPGLSVAKGDQMRSSSLALALALFCAACSDATEVVDTEHVRVDGHLIALHQLDAPSDAAACANERELGAQARSRLQALISGARDVTFRKTGMACLQVMTCDGFVQADGADVGQTLIAEGLAVQAAVPEAGEAPHDWCAGAPIPE